jgi:hypothetical protein
MAISMDLRVLARKLEKSSDDLLVSASTKSPEVFQKVATAVAAASTLLEGVADDMDSNASFEITPQQLDEIAALASAFDESGDPLLKKQASVLDELLLSIAAPKNALTISRKATEDEINRLRAERRKTRGEEAYDEPRQVLSEMENAKAQAKAVEQQVKRYIPMEAPLQTRYPPDRPGGQMTRITDHVYQDIVTGIIYDYKAGYKTQKGNEVPGGSVEAQTRELGDNRNQGSSLFETRESLMGRYASSDEQVVKIAGALKAIRDHAPGLLDRAIDNAMASGLSTTQVADILASDISEQGLKTLAEDSTKKKREPLKSNVNRTLSHQESEREYHNLKSVLNPLAEVIAADPKNSGIWLRMIEDYIRLSQDLGLHQIHQTLLYNEFLNQKNPKGQPTKKPARYIDVPEAHSDTMLDGIVARQSLMGLVINAVQELAPHLLKATIAKAQAEGLEDYQIKSVLASGFSNQFSKPSDEIKVAESLFPHLQDLGWNDLVEKHISVMAGFGVKKADLSKIAEQYGTADVRSLSRLGRVLKTAGVHEFSAEELGDVPAPAATTQILDPFIDEEEEAGPDLTSIALQVVQYIKSKIQDPNEYLTLRRSLVGRELILAIAHYESNKFKNKFDHRTFSEFANLVSEWTLAELSKQAPVATTKAPILTAPIEESVRPAPKQPSVVKIPEAQTAEDFDEDSEEYQTASSEAQNFFAEEKPHKILADIYLAEQARAKKQYKKLDPDTSKAKKIFDAVIIGIIERNLAGEGPTNEELLEEVLAENRKVAPVPFLTKVKEHELTQGAGESAEQFQERKNKQYSPPMEQKHLEIGKTVEEDNKDLSKDKPAQNTKFKWGDYQAKNNVVINEVQANEMERDILSRIKAEKEQLEAEFRNYIIKTESTPDTITNLPDDIRSQVNDMLGRGEASLAVSSSLSKLNSKLREEKKETFIVPPVADLSRQRYLILGTVKDQELDEYRKKMLSRILRRTTNEVLGEAGFDEPMFQNEEGDDITFPQVRKELQQIIGIEKVAVPFVRKAPIGPNGVKLIQFWEDPVGYWQKFKDTDRGWGESERKLQDIDMITAGYNSPDESVFRYTTPRQMFRNIDKETTGNILPSFKIPGKKEEYKTLFSHPEEYKAALTEAKKNFSTVWRDKPNEWKQIVGANPNDIADIPADIKRRLLSLAFSNTPNKRYYEIAASKGIDEGVAKRIRDFVKSSGAAIQKNIMGMAFSGMSFADMKEQIMEDFPGAQIPWDAVEYVFENLQSDKEDTEESQRQQNEWMAEKGFYPPYQIAVGGLGKDRERGGKSKRRVEPVTFASIVFPKKSMGLRDPGLKDEGESLESMKKKSPQPSVKSKIAPPSSKPAPRQPGVGVDNRIKGLESFLSKK